MRPLRKEEVASSSSMNSTCSLVLVNMALSLSSAVSPTARPTFTHTHTHTNRQKHAPHGNNSCEMFEKVTTSRGHCYTHFTHVSFAGNQHRVMHTSNQ